MFRMKGIILAIMTITLVNVFLWGDIKTDLNIFEIKPNPMSRTTEITLGFNDKINVNVFIENEHGELIKHLYTGVIDYNLVLPWDRLDDNGQFVPSGKVNVVVNYNNRYTSTKKTLILK